jgi:nitroreductase
MDPAKFSVLLASRRSTRDFLPKVVPQEVIDAILTDAMTAPSWSNTRPYMVAVATGDARDRISTELQRRWAIASAALRGSWWDKVLFFLKRDGLPTSDYQVWRPYPKDVQPRSQKIGRDLYAHIGVARGDKVGRDEQWARNFDMFGAPVAIFVFTHKGLPTYSVSDAGLFMQNLMLAARARGLHTCPQAAWNSFGSIVLPHIGAGEQEMMVCGMALGYANPDELVNTFYTPRVGVESYTTWLE